MPATPSPSGDRHPLGRAEPADPETLSPSFELPAVPETLSHPPLRKKLSAVVLLPLPPMHLVFPAPCTLTLHPTHFTLYTKPCTLHTTPYTLHPAPCTLHPTPYTLHPAPYTLNPKSQTLNPKPYNTTLTLTS